MAKWFIIIMLLIMVSGFLLTACSSSIKSFNFKEHIIFANTEVTMKHFEYIDTTGYFDIFTGYILTFDIANNGDEILEPCDFDFNYVDSEGNQVNSIGVFNIYRPDSIMPHAKKEFEVKFQSDIINKNKGIIYMIPKEYQCIDENCNNKRTCPNYKIKITR